MDSYRVGTMKLKDINTFIDILNIYTKRSTCSRVKVAAIIVKDGRIISTGWNGSPTGVEHCEEVFKGQDMSNFENKSAHQVFSNKYEIHAEQNAIAFAARNGISTDGCSIITKISPCTYCAKLIIAAGITEMYYEELYDRDGNDSLDLLRKANVKCFKINSSKE